MAGRDGGGRRERGRRRGKREGGEGRIGINTKFLQRPDIQHRRAISKTLAHAKAPYQQQSQQKMTYELPGYALITGAGCSPPPPPLAFTAKSPSIASGIGLSTAILFAADGAAGIAPADISASHSRPQRQPLQPQPQTQPSRWPPSRSISALRLG